MQVKIRIINYLTLVMMVNIKAENTKALAGSVSSRRLGLVKVIK